AFVGAARRPHLRDVGPADALRVHAVTIGTAGPEEAHAASYRVGVAFERVLRRRGLGAQQRTTTRHTQPHDQRRTPSVHGRFLRGPSARPSYTLSARTVQGQTRGW